MSSMYFGHIHPQLVPLFPSTPTLPFLTLMGKALLNFFFTTFYFFYCTFLSVHMSGTNSYMGVGLCTGAWETYQWPASGEEGSSIFRQVLVVRAVLCCALLLCFVFPL